MPHAHTVLADQPQVGHDADADRHKQQREVRQQKLGHRAHTALHPRQAQHQQQKHHAHHWPGHGQAQPARESSSPMRLQHQQHR